MTHILVIVVPPVHRAAVFEFPLRRNGAESSEVAG
jgi:hypothetical protein